MRPRSITSLVLGLTVGFILNGQSADSRSVATANPPGLVSLDAVHDALVVKRELQIARLRDYASRGVFPLNKDFPGKLVPCFVDDVGTACAVGHLMQMDGQASSVAKIAAASNHIRIENVNDGPLLSWILGSGLTKDECALIQPSYATIEDYRRGREWQAEHKRLVRHFASVEAKLIDRSQKSLREALIAKVDAQLAENPDDPALAIKELEKSLNSDEQNVRIAAAHAITKVVGAKPSVRLAALRPNLSHPDLAVKFWTGVAIQEVGAASPKGKAELHGLTLPVFLETAPQRPSTGYLNPDPSTILRLA